MDSERTPLLSGQNRRPSSSGEDDSVLARTLSPSHWLAPEPSVPVEDTTFVKNDNPPNDQPYLVDMTPGKFWFMYAPILFVFFVASFDGTLMASSHPVITSYFHSSNSASWLSTAFMLASTTFQPLCGRSSDAFGRRPLYVLALMIFGVATAWCGLAQSMTSFIIARAFCGLGAGGVMAMASIITNDIVKIEFRGSYQAYINIFFGLGSSCGAAFGGFLCDRLGWRWTFGIQVPFVVIILCLGLFSVPSDLGPMLAKKSGHKWFEALRDFDFAGSFCLTLSTACLILGLNLGGNVLPWTHPIVITSLIISVVAGFALAVVERKAPRPVMPLFLLASFPRANMLFSNFFSQIGVLTVMFNAPLYFQAVKLDTPSVSGFRLAGPSFMLTLCAVGTGFFINWTGRLKAPQIAGCLSMLLGSILLSSLWDGIPTWLATIFVIPPSAGQGFMFPTTTMSLLATSSRADQAIITAAVGVFRNLGSVMGVALSSLILQNALVSYLDQYVEGPNKAEVIRMVRREVRSIAGLDAVHQAQVIHAYREALRWTFISAIIFFVIVNALIWPIRLPRLGRDRLPADDEDAD